MREEQRRHHRVRMDIRHTLLSGLPGVQTETNEHSPDVAINSAEIGGPQSGLGQRITDQNAQKFAAGREANWAPKEVVIVAKHLCGVATDLALRSLECFRRPVVGAFGDAVTDAATAGVSAQAKAKAKGVAIATCCHHACNWADYTGKKFFQDEVMNKPCNPKEHHKLTKGLSFRISRSHIACYLLSTARFTR